MMKEWISGRQFLCLLLVFAFTFALLGCAQSAEAASAAGTAEGKTGAPGFFLTAEYDRLYFAPLDGSSPRLVADSSTLCTARWGEWLYAAFTRKYAQKIEIQFQLSAPRHNCGMIFPR